MKRYIIFILSFWSCFTLLWGQYSGEFLEYNNTNTPAITGNPTTFTAELQIKLKTGFHYKATAGKAAHFRMLCSTVPDEVNLTYINTDPLIGNAPNNISYSGVRVGEYYWMTSNFKHKNPKRGVLWNNSTVPKDKEMPNMYYNIGYENEYPIDQANILNKYMDRIKIARNKFEPDIDAFNESYGLYYSRESAMYMHVYGEMTERSGTPRSKWGFPTHDDFKQLFAMCRVTSHQKGLRELDIRLDLAPKPVDGDVLYSNFADPSYPNYKVYWFPHANTNRYKLNIMPGGARTNGEDTWCNGISGNSSITCNDSVGNVVNKWSSVMGDIYHLFYSFKFFSKKNDADDQPIHDILRNVDVNDWLDFFNDEGWKWMNIRWSRRLTDKELGYKLYINTNKTDIKRLGLLDPKPTGYDILQPGYIRGFYVQYILNNDNPTMTVSQIVELARLTECQQTRTDENRPPCYVAPRSTRDAAFTAGEDYGDAPSLEQAEANPLFIYPNPTAGILNIDAETPIASVKVYNAMGGLEKTFKDIKRNVDLSPLSAGIYTLIIQTNDKTFTFKVMKK